MGLSLYASSITKGRFRKYSQYTTRSRMTGADIARSILSDNNIHDVRIECIAGELSDHYDPSSKTLRLSKSVHDSNSMAAFGVAAHEVGHAIYNLESLCNTGSGDESKPPVTVIKTTTKSLLEEPRAELTAIRTLQLLLDLGVMSPDSAARHLTSFALQDLRRFG